MARRRTVVLAALAYLLAATAALAAASDVQVPALDGTTVTPLAAPSGVTLLLFVTTDCPIANRYAPEVRRIHEAFGDRVTFWLVYAGTDRPTAELAAHHASFGFSFDAVRDPEGALVAATGVTVTPEVAVYAADQQLIYRGRIDDQYVEFGVTRAVPATRDLRDVLAGLVAGERLTFTETQAVGCYIPDRGD